MHLKKSYIVFDFDKQPSRDVDNIKHLYKDTNSNWVGKQKGVCFKFSKNRVVAFGAVGESCDLSYCDIDDIVFAAKGRRVPGDIVLQIYHGRLPIVYSKAQLVILHHKIAIHPPKGLVMNTMDLQASDVLMVKLSPYVDGFCLSIRVDAEGLVQVLGDARGCEKKRSSEVFRRRSVAAIRSLHESSTS
ncbi:unnamed protein product [Ectocarpus sp. 6 AP-2014]